ncbi:MAG: cryptochrome/photolyase family protein [Limimaricola sp.]|uniref:cryptochrome/photolyase family protein n=1 Tax=Limimaricola sp. TaxID=2211665 RepID=UPI001E0FF206|nr:cryptochrome/photolyase family protein [Limimaricola sp.]MBI1415787.1 cryptochrome/photolyase family protein [Limimaricola sp.]
MVRLILVLGDQLLPGLRALREGDPARDVVVMAEVMGEAGSVPHHPKKIAFLFAAMRKFAARLQEAGWQVAYSRLDDPENSQSIVGELLRRAAESGAVEVLATEPGDWRLIAALEESPVPVHLFEDDRFLCSHAEFDAWAEGRKELRMEYFYREMRRRTGLLMEGGKPAGGQWNFDAENRKPPPGAVEFDGPLRFEPDETVRAVLDIVAERFAGHFGTLEPFWFPTEENAVQAHFEHWLAAGLPRFGDYQDAMMAGQPFMYHAVIGQYLNAGLLEPLAICRQVEAAWQAGRVPLNAAEGFIRQVIGWREYVRGVWFRAGPDYEARNALDAHRPLPALYWGAPTAMACMGAVVAQTRDEAYAHHIQRLMVTGNFALLAGLDPAEVQEWYLAVYADAYPWVEAPNVVGMTLFADGGLLASKPYAASGAYIDRMSDYCGGCAYAVKDKTGPNACPFNLLYWHFMDRQRARLGRNARLRQVYATWDRMDPARRETVLAEAEAWLARLDAGEVV